MLATGAHAGKLYRTTFTVTLKSVKMDVMESMPEKDRREIVAFVGAMMTAVQVQKVSEHLGYRTRFVENAAAISETGSSEAKHPAE